jgi:DNA-binding GntR family transcriptional regulator
MAATAGAPISGKESWPPLTPPRKVMVRESVYEAIKGLLMDNFLTPGSRLSIDRLSRELEVSQTPVREALTRLESDGLVVRRPNAGFTVAPLLSDATLGDLYEMRLLIEPLASRRAAELSDVDDIARMRAAVTGAVPVASGDTYSAYREFAVMDATLHLAIAAAGGNPFITEALERLRPHAQTYRLYYRNGIVANTIAEHAAVVDAIAAAEPERAEQAMRRHLEASRDRLLTASPSSP